MQMHCMYYRVQHLITVYNGFKLVVKIVITLSIKLQLNIE